MTDVATGTTIAFGTSGFNAEILGFDIDFTREAYDTTHLGSTEHTKAPKNLVDYGELPIRVNFDPDITIPIDAATETITITYPLPAGGTTPATLIGSGFASGFSATADLEEKMEGVLTVTWAAKPTFTAST